MRWAGLLLAIGAPVALAQVAPRTESLDMPSAPTTAPARIDLRLSPGPRETLVLPHPVLVKAFRISGLSAIPESELQSALAGWVGRELSTADLALLADAATRRLRDAGLLVAMAYVPRQEIRDGVMEIAVIEGRLGKVDLEVAEGARLRRGVAEKYLSTLETGDSIRADNVRQSLMLLNDLPGTRAEATLAAGERPGVADLRVGVRNDGAPWTGSLTLDNAALESVGTYRADLNLRWRSPLDLGDLLTLRWLQTSAASETIGVVTYGLPINGHGTRIGIRISEQRYHLREEFRPLKAHGESAATSFLLTHPIVREGARNLTLGLSHTAFDFRDRIDRFGFKSDVRQRATGASLAYDALDRWLGGGSTQLQAQYFAGRSTQHVPILAVLDELPGSLRVYGPFSVLRYQAQRDQSLGPRTALRASVRGQLASKNLDAGPELALGGPNAVRAYPVGELYADQGYVARFELRHAVAQAADSTTVLSLFHDQARVRVNRNPAPGDPDNRRGLSAHGVGFAHDRATGLSIQSWLAWRGSERPASAPDRAPRVWVSVATRF